MLVHCCMEFLDIINDFGWMDRWMDGDSDMLVQDFRKSIDRFISVLYQGLWMYPIYCVSFILNTIWYQEIAGDAYLQRYGKPCPIQIKQMIRDEMYRAILVVFFLLQTVVSYLVPVLGPFLSFLHISWLYSLYCFEYKWSLAGWGLEQRLTSLEDKWVYFAGFGSPFTLATFFVPNFVSKGVFALLFPVFMLLAISNEPPEDHEAVWRLPLFRPSRWLSLQLFRRIGKASGVETRTARSKRKS